MRELNGPAFASSVAALIDRPFGSGDRLALGVSGGPDSLALLLLAHVAFGDGIAALTVDHGLRPDAAVEAEAVAAICAVRGILHMTLPWHGAKPAANLQAKAREARYRLMADWCRSRGFGWLATGHHADDQAETLLMRLARGAGLGGLSGIRAARPLGDGVTLIRPLLETRRAALSKIVIAAGLTAADDPANRDAVYDRTHARNLFRDTPWLGADRIAASAAHLAEAEAALDWAAAAAWRSRVDVGASITVDAAGLPRELARRLVLHALSVIDPAQQADGPQVDRMLATLGGGGVATLGRVKATGGAIWRFAKAPPRRDAPGNG